MIIRDLNSSSVWDYENGYYWFADTRRFGKFCAHFELYQKILDLPGDVAEFGVYKAASLVRFAVFRDLLEVNHSRRIFGFDAFGAFPSVGLSMAEDHQFIDRFEGAGGPGLSVKEVEDIFAHKGYPNIFLIEGDVFNTLPAFLLKEPQVRFALVHLDMDVYEPTQLVLDQIWERIVPGGLVVVDDYNAVAGATKAIDEFIKKKSIKLEKLRFSHIPTFFFKPL